MLFSTRSDLQFYKLDLSLNHASLHYLLDFRENITSCHNQRLSTTVGLYDILKIHVCINM